MRLFPESDLPCFALSSNSRFLIFSTLCVDSILLHANPTVPVGLRKISDRPLPPAAKVETAPLTRPQQRYNRPTPTRFSLGPRGSPKTQCNPLVQSHI